MSAVIRIKYDSDVDALYLTLSEGTVDETIEVEESVYIDVDGDGRPVGPASPRRRRRIAASPSASSPRVAEATSKG